MHEKWFMNLMRPWLAKVHTLYKPLVEEACIQINLTNRPRILIHLISTRTHSEHCFPCTHSSRVTRPILKILRSQLLLLFICTTPIWFHKLCSLCLLVHGRTRHQLIFKTFFWESFTSEYWLLQIVNIVLDASCRNILPDTKWLIFHPEPRLWQVSF